MTTLRRCPVRSATQVKAKPPSPSASRATLTVRGITGPSSMKYPPLATSLPSRNRPKTMNVNTRPMLQIDISALIQTFLVCRMVSSGARSPLSSCACAAPRSRAGSLKKSSSRTTTTAMGPAAMKNPVRQP